jgi:hypothetical protein
MKELIVDFRWQQREHDPIHIDRSTVEKVKSFKFHCVYITDNLKCSTLADNVVKKAQQSLFKVKNPVSPPNAGLSRGWCGQPNASPGVHCLRFRTSTAPGVTGRP